MLLVSARYCYDCAIDLASSIAGRLRAPTGRMACTTRTDREVTTQDPEYAAAQRTRYELVTASDPPWPGVNLGREKQFDASNYRLHARLLHRYGPQSTAACLHKVRRRYI